MHNKERKELTQVSDGAVTQYKEVTSEEVSVISAELSKKCSREVIG